MFFEDWFLEVLLPLHDIQEVVPEASQKRINEFLKEVPINGLKRLEYKLELLVKRGYKRSYFRGGNP